MNIGLPAYGQSDSLTFEVLVDDRKLKSLSAETETTPKVVIWKLSAPKPKPKFGRSLTRMIGVLIYNI